MKEMLFIVIFMQLLSVLSVKVNQSLEGKLKLCRNISLLSYEYKITNDSFIKTVHSSEQYHFQNNNITLCFPFTKKFKKCIKWILHEQEVVNLSTNILHSPIHNKSYYPGEYDVRNHSVYVCLPENMLPFYYIDVVYSSAGILSAISLFVTIIIIFKLPVGLYDRRPMLGHMFNFLMWYIMSVVYTLAPLQKGIFCDVIASFGPYTMRSAFCWLNVVMVDLWHRFRNENILKKLKGNSSCKVFTLQSVYACGMPCLIIGFSKLFPITPVYSKPYTSNRCTLGSYTEQNKMIFLGIATGLSQFANVVFAVLTIINLRKINEETLRANSSNTQQLVLVYIKLLAVTGASWLLGFIEWATVPFTTTPSKFWIVIDVLYTLQGFVLFCIYSCSNYVQNQLHRKLSCVTQS